jgi:hypothetical protein
MITMTRPRSMSMDVSRYARWSKTTAGCTAASVIDVLLMFAVRSGAQPMRLHVKHHRKQIVRYRLIVLVQYTAEQAVQRCRLRFEASPMLADTI